MLGRERASIIAGMRYRRQRQIPDSHLSYAVKVVMSGFDRTVLCSAQPSNAPCAVRVHLVGNEIIVSDGSLPAGAGYRCVADRIAAELGSAGWTTEARYGEHLIRISAVRHQ